MKMLTLKDIYHANRLEYIENNEPTEFSFSGTDRLYEIKDCIRLLRHNRSAESFSIYFEHTNTAKVRLIFNFLEQRKNTDEIKIYGLFENISENNDQELFSEIIKIYTQLINNGLEINSFPIVFTKIKFIEAQTFTPFVSKKLLKKLDLPSNKIGDDGVRIILESSTIREMVESINFEGNNLTDESTLYLEQFLKNSNSLQEFNLSKNGLTNVCLERLKEGLFVNQSLTELGLMQNKLKIYNRDFRLSKELVETFLRINSYIKIVQDQQKKLKINNFKNEKHSFEDKKYLLKTELEHTNNLKNYYNEDMLASYLLELDQNIRSLYIGTPTPLEIILKSKKFLRPMNLYIAKSTCNKISNLDQDNAIEETIKQFKSYYSTSVSKKYSFYYFYHLMKKIEKKQTTKISKDITLTEEQKQEKLKEFSFTNKEKKAIKIYEKHPHYDKSFLYYSRQKLTNKYTAKFMASDAEEAIKIQQLTKIFGCTLTCYGGLQEKTQFIIGESKITTGQLFGTFYDHIFVEAIDIYSKAVGYNINNFGEYKLDVSDQQCEMSGNISHNFYRPGVIW